uniref:Uncharacterized protein n=1 Tax=Rhizophora mucronata TaxID=61149 RepID=A0A2P2QS26_RHIMU
MWKNMMYKLSLKEKKKTIFCDSIFYYIQKIILQNHNRNTISLMCHCYLFIVA